MFSSSVDVGVLHVGAGGSAQIMLNTVSSTFFWVTPSTCKLAHAPSPVRFVRICNVHSPHLHTDERMAWSAFFDFTSCRWPNDSISARVNSSTALRHSSLSMPLGRLGCSFGNPAGIPVQGTLRGRNPPTRPDTSLGHAPNR